VDPQLADNQVRGLEGKTGSLYLVFFPEHKQRIQHKCRVWQDTNPNWMMQAKESNNIKQR